jgi:hypothetical protein
MIPVSDLNNKLRNSSTQYRPTLLLIDLSSFPTVSVILGYLNLLSSDMIYYLYSKELLDQLSD